jgi:hypothetical protein
VDIFFSSQLAKKKIFVRVGTKNNPAKTKLAGLKRNFV